jgi:hypothetical protein
MKKIVLAVGFLCGAVLCVCALGPSTAHAQEDTKPIGHIQPPYPPCTFWAAQGCLNEMHYSWWNDIGCWLVSTTSFCAPNGFNNCLQSTMSSPASAEVCALLNDDLQALLRANRGPLVDKR